MTFEEMWRAALGEIELQISKANFKTWFQNTLICDKKEGLIMVGVPNTFTKEWLENKYHKFILRALRNLDTEVKEVQYQIHQEKNSENTQKKKEAPKTLGPAGQQLEFQELEVNKITNLNPKYTFQNFIVGSSNELAHAACTAVTDKLGKKYNPLFIYGGVGLGKTHLLQATGNAVCDKYGKNKKVKYVNSEKFTSEMISALRSGNIDYFKNNYREVDLLIIDDIQFFSGKERTQEIFFHTFNTLYENDKQIILSSDRPPKSIPILEERLRSRFQGGMIADIGFPDFETRLAILKSKTQEKNFNTSDEVLNLIATSVQKNIRELEGVLNRVIATCQLNNQILSLKQVEQIITSVSAPKKQITNFKAIIKTVSDFYNINEKEILERSRKKEIVRPRQIAMYLMREEIKSSYPFIGMKLGGRDHTTAIHACEKIEKELNQNQTLSEEINLLKERLYNTF